MINLFRFFICVLSIIIVFSSHVSAQFFSKQIVNSQFNTNIFPETLLFSFTIFSESEKGNVPIENIESVLLIELKKLNINPNNLFKSSIQLSSSHNYRKYILKIQSENECINAHKVLNANPFVQSLQIYKSLLSANQLKQMEDKMIVGVWKLNLKNAQLLASAQNKYLSKLSYLDATALFEYKKSELYDKINGLYIANFQNNLTTEFYTYKDSITQPEDIQTTIKVIGESSLELISEKSELEFRIFNNETNKYEKSLEKIEEEINLKLKSLGFGNENYHKTNDNYDDYFDYKITEIGGEKLLILMEYLTKNKNIVNLKIKNHYIPISLYNEKILYQNAIQDARAKANKICTILDNNIETIISTSNVKEEINLSETFMIEDLDMEEWKNKCKITYKRKLIVEFLTN